MHPAGPVDGLGDLEIGSRGQVRQLAGVKEGTFGLDGQEQRSALDEMADVEVATVRAGRAGVPPSSTEATGMAPAPGRRPQRTVSGRDATWVLVGGTPTSNHAGSGRLFRAREQPIRGLVAGRADLGELRVRELANEEGNRLLRIVRRSPGSVVTWRKAQMVLLSAQGMDVAEIARNWDFAGTPNGI